MQNTPEKAAKHVLYDQAIFTTVGIGANNFIVALLDSHDYATSCLVFTGFFFISLFYKLWEVKLLENRSSKAVWAVFFRHFYTPRLRKVHWWNVGHLLFRAVNFFLLTWLVIISSHYALMANINFGIISTCMSISAVLNCIGGVLFWHEKLKPKMIVGTVVILLGVSWISLQKGTHKASGPLDEETQAQHTYYKVMSIGLALFSGLLSALRVQQAKYVAKYYNYSPLDFSVDAGLVIGIVTFLSAAFYWVQGPPASYNWHNFLICIGTSSLHMLTSLVGLNCVVKGLAGPTTAIFQASCIISISLNMVFFDLVPTTQQMLGALVTVGGVLVMFLGK